MKNILSRRSFFKAATLMGLGTIAANTFRGYAAASVGPEAEKRIGTIFTEKRTLGSRKICLLCTLLMCGACYATQPAASNLPIAANAAATIQPEGTRMWMTIGERRFAITLADTEAAREFAAMLPLTIEMPDFNNNEKHAQLPQSLSTEASRPGTIRNGDIMLYGSRTLVVFYLTFKSSYSYTRLGQVDDPVDLAQVLGRGTARITFSKN